MSNTRSASNVRKMSATRIAGRSNGSVIRQNWCNLLAPSTPAASYRSCGMTWSPARTRRATKGVVVDESPVVRKADALRRLEREELLVGEALIDGLTEGVEGDERDHEERGREHQPCKARLLALEPGRSLAPHASPRRGGLARAHRPLPGRMGGREPG